MDTKYPLLILKHRAKLHKLITEDAPYEQILHQSQILDKYVNMQLNSMNKITNA